MFLPGHLDVLASREAVADMEATPVPARMG